MVTADNESIAPLSFASALKPPVSKISSLADAEVNLSSTKTTLSL